jgi:hypothetical protein
MDDAFALKIEESEQALCKPLLQAVLGNQSTLNQPILFIFTKK